MTTPPPGHLENDVLVGADGMLFLAGGAHGVLAQVTGERPLPEAAVRVFAANLRHRRHHAGLAGHRYVHLITPDKQSILPEAWPLRDRPFHRMGQAALDRLGPEAADVLYPLETLAAIGAPAVWATDTHYTDHGSIAVAAEVAARLTGGPVTALRDALLARLTGTTAQAGDLGGKLDPPLTSAAPVLAGGFPGTFLRNEMVQGNDGMMDIHLNPRAPRAERLALMGDSFGRGVALMLRHWFREVVFLRSRFHHAEMTWLLRPHHVVTQNVERYQHAVAPDDRRTHFLLMPHDKGHPYAPPPAFAATLADLLAVGGPRYAAHVRRHFGEDAPVAA